LYREETVGRGRVLRFVGDGRADYCDLITANDKQTVAAIVSGLRENPDWDMLDLGSIPSESPSVGLLKSLCEDAGFRVIVRDHFVCPTLLVRGHEHAVHRILNKPSLRRRQNYFERIGKLEFRNLGTAADIEPYLDSFFNQHTERWHQTGAPSLFHDELNRTFYRDLVARLDGTGWLLFSVVELDGHPIALHYGFDYNDTVIWYKPSFDRAFAAGSPGLVLVRHLIRTVVETGRRELDFTIGDEPFKRRFTNAVRKTVNVQVFRDPALYVFEWSRRGVLSVMRKAAARVRYGW
jgi:CelD/BcsL family acetyltransferase involved in cellulose biosynthesis